MNDVIEFGKSILEAQDEVRDKFSPIIKNGLNANTYIERHSQGVPFLTSSDINIDWNLFNSLLHRLSLLIEHRIEKPVRVDEMRAPELQQTLIDGILNRKQMIDTRIPITDNRTPIIIHLAFTPFMEKYAHLLMKYYKETNWFRGSCPICGREPLMAKIEPETGKRWLQCCLCKTDWGFKRIGCPFCGNMKQKELRFFYVDENSPYRVDVCDECKRYIKTIDTRELKTQMLTKLTNLTNLFIDYVTTTYLDKLAQNEGFCSSDTGLLDI